MLEHFLGVWVETTKNLVDADGKLNAAVINIKRIPGFSTNKIPESFVRDLRLKFLDQQADFYLAPWQPGENGIIPNKSHYTVANHRKFYFIRLGDMHGFTDKYMHHSDKTRDFEFSVSVVHKPLVANYWHFELLVNSEHNIIKRPDPKWRELVCASVLNRIQDVAVIRI